MSFRLLNLLKVFVVLWSATIAASRAISEDKWTSDQQADFFEAKIRPALLTHCIECHAVETEASGGLLLDSRQGWQAGGDSANTIVPGDPTASMLIRAIRYEDPELQMPPSGKLPEQVIRNFAQWIERGAFDPRDSHLLRPVSSTALSVDAAQTHWAYRDVQPVQIPQAGACVGSTPIDAFINHRLSEHGLSPAPRAADQVLVRRLYYDLLGLPPTPEQTNDALALLEQGDLGYVQLVDQLLANVQYAENFARKWMDVTRFAESITLRGFVLPQAWRYRDYLITAYAADRPFDLMIRQQVAGDLLPADDWKQRQEQVVATAFLVLGNTNLEKQDKTQLEMDTIDEQLEVIGRAFLGQTIGCARCHDHKFDPIPTRDYYAMAGILRAAVSLEHDNVSKWIELPLPGPTESQTPTVADTTGDDVDQRKEDKVQRETYMTLVEKNPPADIPIHVRGEAHNLGPVVPRGFLTALQRDGMPSIGVAHSGRVEMAQWLSSAHNPLTARVYANRVWSWLMTRGIAPSVNNLGTTGVAPTHPELLDWLSLELVTHNWSTKHLVRTIVLSDVYRRSQLVASDAPQLAIDPNNRLWWRAPARRISAEALRDAMLLISGELDNTIGGSLIAAGTKTDYNYPHRTTRRSVYHPVFRNSLPELFEAFDFADPSTSIGQRSRSTVATQGLALLNHPWVVARAKATALRLSANGWTDNGEATVQFLFQSCFSRIATDEELAACIEFLQMPDVPAAVPTEFTATDELPVDRLEALVHSLFASLDFRYLD